MPKYLPRPDLPPLVYNLLTERKYQESLSRYFQSLPVASRGLKKVSTTTLARSVRQRLLEERHDKEITINPTEKMWSLMGNLVHEMLERQARPGDRAEERIGMDVTLPSGEKIHAHGQYDLFYHTEDRLEIDGVLHAYMPAKTMVDYKVTGAWAIAKGEKFEHVSQQNINRLLMRKVKGITVEHMKNVFFFRDWKSHEARKFEQYPQDRIVVMDISMWEDKKAEDYLIERLLHHSQGDGVPDDDLPLCTPDERWQSMPEYKVFKFKEDGERMKNSKFTSNSKLEAEEWMEEAMLTEWAKVVSANEAKKRGKKLEHELPRPKYEIKTISAKPEKCSHCLARPFCSQWAEDVAKGYVKVEQETEEEQDDE